MLVPGSWVTSWNYLILAWATCSYRSRVRGHLRLYLAYIAPDDDDEEEEEDGVEDTPEEVGDRVGYVESHLGIYSFIPLCSWYFALLIHY